MSNTPLKVLQLRASGSMLGAENVVLEIANYSKEFDVECIIGIPLLETDEVPEFAVKSEKAGIAVKQFKYRSTFDLNLSRSIKKYVEENDIDLIHCHGYQEDFYALLAKTGKPLVATNHLWKRTTTKLKIYAQIDSFIMRYFKKIVAVSKPIFDEVSTLGYGKKSSIIANGVNVPRFTQVVPSETKNNLRQEFNLNDDTVVVGMVSSLTREKDHETALKSFKKHLDAGNSNTKLLIIGHGDERENLDQLVKELNLSQHVTFAGQRSDILELLSIMDIYLLSSLKEGLPISLLEAMASKLPVICSDVGDICQVINDGVNGYLVNSEDTDTFAEKISLLANDKTLREKIAIQSQQTIIDHYSAQNMSKNYCLLYKEVLSK